MKDLLESIQIRLKHLEQGLALLGAQPCNHCGEYFRSSDHAALFEWKPNEFICYTCLKDWWTQKRLEFSVPERFTVEMHLKRWLCSQHHAVVVRQAEKLPQDPILQIVTACEACGGTTTENHHRCSTCDGQGTVWVVVMPEL
jgi:hypothetical protein